MPQTGIGHVEIPVEDMERAVDFYGKVFVVDFELTEFDGVETALFPEAGEGASVALARGDGYAPCDVGPRVYLAVGSIDEALAGVVASGGEML